MPASISKAGFAGLTNPAPSSPLVVIGSGGQTRGLGNNQDLDARALLRGVDGEVTSDADFRFFHQPRFPDNPSPMRET